ncbi:MAG: cell division protein FtsZ [Muribaculaceae bacterium]|nr:cell division protein FtsZ [Muribaculaceae bacterium]
MSVEELDNDCDFVLSNDVTPEIMVIGVGGGGNNAIDNMYKEKVENVEFVVCNTDAQALNKSKVPKKLLIGPMTTKGLGAGNNPSVARLAAEESYEDINDLFDERTKMVFVTAGMGGGTGTGAAPIVAKVARERGLLTIGIVTIPFLFEGNPKILKALDGVDEMKKYVDALLVINNERLCDIYGDLDFLNAFGKADDTLTTAARSISELITVKGYINLDFNDVDTTLRGGGAAIISSGYGEGENRVTKAFNEALNSPLLKNRDITSSKKLLFNIYFSQNATHKFEMKETSEITSFITELNPTVDVIWGATIDDSLGDKIKITILAAGFNVDLKEDNSDTDNGQIMFVSDSKIVKPITPPSPERIKDVYGDDKVDDLQKHKYIILNTAAMEDDSIIESLEANPTFNRDKVLAEELRKRIKALAEGKAIATATSKDASNAQGQVVSFMG